MEASLRVVVVVVVVAVFDETPAGFADLTRYAVGIRAAWPGDPLTLRAGVSKTKTSQPNRRASFRLVSLRRRTPDQYRTQPKQHRKNRNLSD